MIYEQKAFQQELGDYFTWILCHCISDFCSNSLFYPKLTPFQTDLELISKGLPGDLFSDGYKGKQI